MFEFITDDFEREMLQDAYNAITVTENWNFMKPEVALLKEPCDTYMFSTKPQIYTISNAMKVGHSGASFGMVMRVMQYIAQHGMEAYEKCRQNI